MAAFFRIAAVSILLTVLCGGVPAVSASIVDGATVEAERQRAEQLVQVIPLTEILGPLAPVALSPFFALTCLSGASMLVDAGVLPENGLLRGNSILGSGFVFFVLLALTAATSAPKFMKVTKPVGQALDQVESYSGIVVFLLIVWAAHRQAGIETAEAGAVVYSAGVLSFTWETLVLSAVALNIFVINIVKFFFEFLIWLSPIPAIDAAFETANKLFTVFLVGVYAFNPWVATLLNLAIFLVCLVVFSWCWRRVVYYRATICGPILASLFFRPGFDPGTARLPGSVRRRFDDPDFGMKVFLAGRWEGLKKRSMAYLVGDRQGIHLAVPRLLRRPRVFRLDGDGHSFHVDSGLFSGRIRVGGGGGKPKAEFTFSRRYLGEISQIARRLAASVKPPDEDAAETFKDARRQIAAAVRSGGTDRLKAELG